MSFGRRIQSLMVRGRYPGGSLRSVQARAASSSVTAEPQPIAAAPVTDQQSFAQDALYTALRSRLGDASGPLASNQVYAKLVNPSRLVDDFNFARTTKRLARQHAAFRFLRRHNVLLHGLLFYAPLTATWNTTAEFARLSLLGESVLRAEVRGRLLKLFPDMPHEAYAASVEALTSQAAVTALFDALLLEQVVGSKPPRNTISADTSSPGGAKRGRVPAEARITITNVEKCAMLRAIVGEMYWFAARTKATDRTHNNALFPPSDVLILHVLCTHLLECVPAELVFHELEPMVQRLRGVWVNEPMSVPFQLRLKPRTIRALSLASAPHKATPEELQRRTMPLGATVVPLTKLTTTADSNYLKSRMRPQVSHKRFDAVMSPDGSAPSGKRREAPALSPQRSTHTPHPVDPELWGDSRRWELSHPEAQPRTSPTMANPH